MPFRTAEMSIDSLLATIVKRDLASHEVSDSFWNEVTKYSRALCESPSSRLNKKSFKHLS